MKGMASRTASSTDFQYAMYNLETCFCTKCASQTFGDEFRIIFESLADQHVRDKFVHFSSRFHQTMQHFVWQEEMRSVVHLIQECLPILLPANVAEDAVHISSDQP